MKPLRGMAAVYLREMLILRRRILKQFASWLVSPLLYLVAFHYAMNDTLVGSRPYADFLLPGLVAMSSMTQSWAIASDINISRFYWHTFDEFQTAPLHAAAYVTGEVLAGMTRAVLACLVVMGIGLLGGIQIAYGAPGLWLALLLNAWFFSSLAVALALHVKAHADQALLSNFVITPMAFLGGTFFPLDRLPDQRPSRNLRRLKSVPPTRPKLKNGEQPPKKQQHRQSIPAHHRLNRQKPPHLPLHNTPYSRHKEKRKQPPLGTRHSTPWTGRNSSSRQHRVTHVWRNAKVSRDRCSWN